MKSTHIIACHDCHRCVRIPRGSETLIDDVLSPHPYTSPLVMRRTPANMRAMIISRKFVHRHFGHLISVMRDPHPLED